jgi:hypothetical protein
MVVVAFFPANEFPPAQGLRLTPKDQFEFAPRNRETIAFSLSSWGADASFLFVSVAKIL